MQMSVERVCACVYGVTEEERLLIAVRYITVQYSTILQYITAQHSTIVLYVHAFVEPPGFNGGSVYLI